MLQATYRIFIKGLFALLPILVTLYLIFWLIWAIESLFGGVILVFLPDTLYIPGMGILVGVLVIFAIGLMLEAWFMQAIWRWGEKLLDRLPPVRQLYGWMKQLVDYISDKGHPQGRVVMVTLEHPPMKLLGLVTLEHLEFDELDDQDLVAVFLPLSYQIGGYTVYIPRASLEPVDMDTKEALQFTLTAGVGPVNAKKKAARHPTN